MPILVSNYENRLKDFLYKMAQSPKVIKDHQKAVTSTRKELYDEENHKILAGKGFVLKQFKTEKQRLQEQLNTQEALDLREDILNMLPLGSEFQNISQLSKSNVDNILKLKAFYDKKNKLLNQSKLNQPNMRFTAKNNLERLFDSLNIYSYGRVDKDQIERRKKQFGFKKNNIKNNEYNSSDDDDDDDSREKSEMNEKEIEASANYNNNRYNKKNGHKVLKIDDKKIMQKHDQNSQVRHIMSDLHEKTHFKGASGFTLWKNTSISNRLAIDDEIKNDSDDNGNYYKHINTNGKNNSNSKFKDTSWEKFQLKRFKSQLNFTPYNISPNNKNNIVNNLTKQKVQFEMNLTNSSGKNIRGEYSNNITNRASTVENSYRFEDYINNVNDSLNHNYLLNKLDIEEDLAKSNPLLYNLTLNTYKKKYENRDETDKNKLNYIKRIAFDADLNNGKKKDLSNKVYIKKLFSKNDYDRKLSKRKSLLETDPVAFFEKYKDNIEDVNYQKTNNLESI